LAASQFSLASHSIPLGQKRKHHNRLRQGVRKQSCRTGVRANGGSPCWVRKLALAVALTFRSALADPSLCSGQALKVGATPKPGHDPLPRSDISHLRKSAIIRICLLVKRSGFIKTYSRKRYDSFLPIWLSSGIEGANHETEKAETGRGRGEER
jgi:hypothetical protein